MADFYKAKDIRNLLANRRILFIGDSNVQPLYKDLVCALSKKDLFISALLKNPEAATSLGDVVVNKYGSKCRWDYRENRLFKQGLWTVELFFVGFVFDGTYYALKKFLLRKLHDSSELPDVIYVSFYAANGRNRLDSLTMFLNDLKVLFSNHAIIIVGSPFPTDRQTFCPLYDEVTNFGSPCNFSSYKENMAFMEKASCYGFERLNITQFLQKDAFKHITDQPGGESVVVRFITCLLMTAIANLLKQQRPQRVKDEVFQRAFSSSDDDSELYRNMLLKHISNWTSLKTQTSLRPTDFVALNAEEVVNSLWNCYHRKNTKQPRQSKLVPRTVAAPGPKSLEMTINSTLSPYKSLQPSPRSSPIETSQLLLNPSGENEEPLENDEDSLEEGEIREDQNDESNKSNISMMDNLQDGDNFSESSSDYDFNFPPIADSVRSSSLSSPTLTRRNGIEDAAMDYISPYKQPLNDSAAIPTAINSSASLSETIVISDDDQIVTYSSREDAIINLDDIEVDPPPYSASSRRQTYVPPAVFKPSLRVPSLDEVTTGGERQRGLKLIDSHGKKTLWPIYVCKLGLEQMWRWWRSYIEKNDNHLTLQLDGSPDIHAQIPSCGGPSIAIPKIVDDLRLFLELINGISFPDHVDLTLNIEENNDITPAPKTVLHLAEELARGSVKRVHFEIANKGNDIRERNREASIRIRSFASSRNVQSLKNAAPNSASSSTKRNNYYGYGTGTMLKTISSKNHWSPLNPWVQLRSQSKSGNNHPSALHARLDGATSTKRLREAGEPSPHRKKRKLSH